MHTNNAPPPPPPKLDIPEEEEQPEEIEEETPQQWTEATTHFLGNQIDWNMKNHSMPILIGRVKGHPSYLLSLPSYSTWANAQKNVLDGKELTIPLTERYQTMVKDFPQGSYVIDVGAGVGLVSLPIASMGHRVIAFEPVPSNVEKLIQSVVANHLEQRVTIVEAAVYSERGMMTIYSPNNRANKSSLTYQVAMTSAPGQHTETLVPTETIDSWLSSHRQIKSTSIVLMKISAEGHELDVLKGSKVFLSENLISVTVEISFSPTMIRGASADPMELLQFMNTLGFDVYDGSQLITSEKFNTLTEPTTLRFYHRA